MWVLGYLNSERHRLGEVVVIVRFVITWVFLVCFVRVRFLSAFTSLSSCYYIVSGQNCPRLVGLML